MLPRETLEGPHVWHTAQDSGAREAGRTRRVKRDGNPIRPDRAFSLVSRVTRHSLWPLTDCVSILFGASMSGVLSE